MEINKLLIALLAAVLVSCSPLATPPSTGTPIPAVTSTSIPPAASIAPAPTVGLPPSAYDLSKYAFPASIDPTKRYLFYLHGRIIEDQGLPAVSPDFGEYEYLEILEKLGSYGFVVISEQRPQNTDGLEYARRVTEQVKTLLHAGVPPANITVVGASKGASITVYVSHFLENPETNFVIMGICNPDNVEGFIQNRIYLYGKVLSVYDSADYEYGGSCEELFSFSEGKGGLTRHVEIVLDVGTGHGILYKPLDEWVIPVIQFASGSNTGPAGQSPIHKQPCPWGLVFHSRFHCINFPNMA